MSYGSGSAADRLAAVRVAIEAALKAQAYGLTGQNVERPSLKVLFEQEARLMREVASESGATGGFTVGHVEVHP